MAREVAKHLKQGDSEEMMDRISALPDSFLTYILSCLPTKDAVKTSILSKRWKFAWTRIFNLDFGDDDLWREYSSDKHAKEDAFQKYVDRVLSCHNSFCIQRFILRCHFLDDLSCMPSWIHTAVMRNVEDLDISVLCSTPVVLPHSLYTCERLKVLKLYGDVNLNVPMLVCLRSLNVLWLNEIKHLDSNSMTKLLYGCPLLYELNIKRREGDNALSLYICSPSVKSLMIDDDLVVPKDEICSVVVDMPNLKYFDLKAAHVHSKDYVLMSTPCLRRARIDVCRPYHGSPSAKLLESISKSNGVTLQLSSNTISLLDDCGYEELPVFHKLMHLKVEVSQAGWPFVACLLEKSPNLAFADFMMQGIDEENSYQHQLYQPNSAADCLSSQLMWVQVRNFKDCELDMHVISYLLQNSKFLKSLKIYYGDPNGFGNHETVRVMKKLLKLPRASSTCQVFFSEVCTIITSARSSPLGGGRVSRRRCNVF